MFQNIFTFILFMLVVQNACAGQKREKRFIGALKSWVKEQFDPAEKKPVVILPIPSEHQFHPGQNFIQTPPRVPAAESGIPSTNIQSTEFDSSSLVGSLSDISPLELIGSLHRLASQNGILPSPEFTNAGLNLITSKEGVKLIASLVNAGVITPYRDNLEELADDEDDEQNGQASTTVEVKPGENIKETVNNLKVSKYPFKLPIPDSLVKIIKPHSIPVGHHIRKHHKHRLPYTYKVKTRLIPTGLTPALHTIKHKPAPPKEVHVIHHVEKETPKPTTPPSTLHVEYVVPHPPVGTPHLEYGVPKPPAVIPHLEYGVPDFTYGLPFSVAPSIFNKNVSSAYKVPTSSVPVPHAEYGVPPALVLAPNSSYHLPASTYRLPSYLPPSVFNIGKLLRNPVFPYTFNASPINNNLVPPVASYLSNYAFDYPHRQPNVVPVHNGVQTPSRFSPVSYQVPYVSQYHSQFTSDKTPAQHLNSLSTLFSTAVTALPSEDANSSFRVKPLNTWNSVVNSPTRNPQHISALSNSFAPPLVSQQSLAAQNIVGSTHSSVNAFSNPGSYYQLPNQNQIKHPFAGNNILPSTPVLLNQNAPPTPNVLTNTYIPPLPSTSHFHPPVLEIVKPTNVLVNHTLQYPPNLNNENFTEVASLVIPSSGESSVTVHEEVNDITGDPALVTTYVQPGFSYRQISHNAPLSLDTTPPKIQLTHNDPSFLIVVPSDDDTSNDNAIESEENNVDNSIDAGSESAKIESVAAVEPEQEFEVDSNATVAIDAQVESNTLQPLTPVRLTGFNNQKHNPRLKGMRRRRRYRTTQRPAVIETVPTTIPPTTDKIIDLSSEDQKPTQNVENNIIQLEAEVSHLNLNKTKSTQSEDNVNDLKYRESTTIVDGQPLTLTTFQKPGYSFKIYSKTPGAEDSEEIADDKGSFNEASIDQPDTAEPSVDLIEPLLLKQDVNELLDKSESTHGSPVPYTPLINPDSITVESESEPPNQVTPKPPRTYSRRVVTNNTRTSRGRTRWSPEKDKVLTEVP